MTGTIEISEYVIDAIANAVVKKMQEPCDYYDADNKTCRRSEVPKEPCEDAISRKAVINIVEDMHDLARADVLSEAVKQLNDLPHVTPQQKIGHWIFKNDNVAIPTGYFQCSECNSGKLLHVDNYCPSCGAQMESVKRAESEVEK